MLTSNTIKKLSKPVVVSWITGLLFSGAAQMANADFTVLPGKLQATGPCYLTEQLQKSPSVRKQYAAKLVKVLGLPAASVASNSVEEMYSNIKPAAFQEEEPTEPEQDLWGLGKTASAAPNTQIDPLSADCLGCHDGVSAVPVGTVLRNNPFVKPHRPMAISDHPIGMNYAGYAAASKEYKRVSAGSNKMIFVNGRVGCLTCHDPLNPGKGHLVMSDARSALCLTCHNK